MEVEIMEAVIAKVYLRMIEKCLAEHSVNPISALKGYLLEMVNAFFDEHRDVLEAFEMGVCHV